MLQGSDTDGKDTRSAYRSFESRRFRVETHLSLPLPKNHRTIEGKKHRATAPVKLYKAQSSKHASHPSKKFAQAIIRSLEKLQF